LLAFRLGRILQTAVAMVVVDRFDDPAGRRLSIKRGEVHGRP